MTITFSFTHDIDTVADKLFDPDFRVERCMAMGEVSAECSVEGDDDNFEVRLERVVVRELPSVLAKVFNSQQQLDFRENWQREGEGWKASVDVEIKGQPVVSIRADYTLQPTSSGCEYTAKHHCKAKIPLIGGKVEKFIIGQTDDGAVDELNYLAEALGR